MFLFGRQSNDKGGPPYHAFAGAADGHSHWGRLARDMARWAGCGRAAEFQPVEAIFIAPALRVRIEALAARLVVFASAAINTKPLPAGSQLPAALRSSDIVGRRGATVAPGTECGFALRIRA